MQSVFEYSDYRKFLLDFYREKKAGQKGFSHRHIAEKVGFKSGGHFSQILSGTANISITFIERLADFLELKRRERLYFQNMVLYNQAKVLSDKKRFFEKMMSFRESLVRTVSGQEYEFYDKWYYTAIRELLSFYPFSGDYEDLSRMLVPAISSAEARGAISLLERLELIRRDGAGLYRPSEALITTGYEAQSVCINNFVFNTLALAQRAIDEIDKKERSLSWVALSVSPSGYDAIVEELRQSRRRIMDIAKNDEHPNRAYLFNVQMFPLSRPFPGPNAGAEAVHQ
jgi:uncharacterized protein (TIGR02147 family)